MGGKPGLIAFHLPQFHTIPENDMWWGNGFTEWTNTRKTEKIFPNHNQPREPLNDHYYDLTCMEELLWQMRLARRYGLYGFCYYHYWFSGRLLLNKPLEMVRDYEGDKLSYCLCWANEPWTRTWENRDNTILISQGYGEEAEWESHFQYLLTYFKDPAYIKIDNAPILVIYRMNSIPHAEKLAEFLKRRAQKEGFTDLFLIEELNCYQDGSFISASNAILQFEPLYSMTLGKTEIDKLIYISQSKAFNWKFNSQKKIYGYDRLWKRVIANAKRLTWEKEFYPGAFVDWDNTARKGKKGRIVLGSSPIKFGKYLSKLERLAEKTNARFIFINAWNEWGEGTYLEPDKKHKYEYLEEVGKIWNKE